MKKVIGFAICFIILIVVLVVSLVSCGDRFPYEYSDMKEKVTKVEIVKITYIDFDSSNANKEFIKTLSDDEIDEFLNNLSKIKFTYPLGHPRDLDGYIFVIYYNNDKYEMLSKGATKFYKSNGKSYGGRHRQCTKKEFNNLLSLFIEIDS